MICSIEWITRLLGRFDCSCKSFLPQNCSTDLLDQIWTGNTLIIPYKFYSNKNCTKFALNAMKIRNLNKALLSDLKKLISKKQK